MSNILAFAIRFAQAGYYVIPLMDSKYPRLDESGTQKPLIRPFNWTGTTSKHPTNKHIINTNDPDKVKCWPEEIDRIYKSQLHLAGYGVLGKSCIIFDLDIKHGKDGITKFNEIAKKYDVPSASMIVRSKSGGFHYYFNREAFRLSSPTNVELDGIKFEGVDVRADKAYVVGPTSSDTWQEGEYTLVTPLISSTDLSPCPDSILTQLSDTTTQYLENPLKAMISSNEFGNTVEMAKHLVIPETIPSGERNDVFYAFINAAVRKGLPENTTRKMVQQLIEVTEDKETLGQSVDIEDMISRAYSVDLTNPFAIANDMINKGMYRLSSHLSSSLTYYTLDETYVSMDRPLTEVQLAELTSKYDRAKINKDGSVSQRKDNVAKIMTALIPREQEISKFGYKPGDADVYEDEAGRSKFLNLWVDPRELIVPENEFDDETWKQFMWLTERLFGAPNTKEFRYGIEFARWLLMRPGIRPVTYPLITSECRGTGKNLFVECISRCLGFNKFGVSQAKTYMKESLKNARFLNPTTYSLISFDEVEFAKASGSFSTAVEFNQTIKTLSTCTHAPIEIKGGASYDAPMYAGIIMTSNSVDGLVIDDEDRRTNLFLSTAEPLNPMGGQVDNLFNITKGLGSRSSRRRAVGTIIRGLCEEEETMRLDLQRAWDSPIKERARRSTMTLPQRCIIEYFESGEEFGAVTRVVTRSILRWVISHHVDLMHSKFAERADDTVDGVMRSNVISRINSPGSGRKRQFYKIPVIDLFGQVAALNPRGELFTVGNSREYSNYDGRELKEMLVRNIKSIEKFNKESKI